VLLRLQVKRFNVAAIEKAASLESLIRLQNPVEDVLTVFYDKKALTLVDLHVLDMHGRIVQSLVQESEDTYDRFNISTLSRGLYIVRIVTSEGKSGQWKLVKR
jgi:hypothetical protein